MSGTGVVDGAGSVVAGVGDGAVGVGVGTSVLAGRGVVAGVPVRGVAGLMRVSGFRNGS